MTSPDGDIRVLEDANAWARAHPSFFFSPGQPSVQALKEMLLTGARTLCTGTVSDLSFGDWCVVAAQDDWLSRGAGRQAGRSLFHHLHAFPELGQNCSRPEFLVYAFVADVVSLGPDGISAVKGNVAESAAWATIQAEGWQRVVAFRGLDAVDKDG